MANSTLLQGLRALVIGGGGAGIGAAISEGIAAAGADVAIPLRHRGTPEDIANAVIFFASPMSKQVTGQVLGVDGGVSVASPMPDLSGIGRK